MNHDFASAIRRAAGLTRASDLAEATQVIQEALARRRLAEPSSTRGLDDTLRPPHRPLLRLVEPVGNTPEIVGPTTPSPDLPGLNRDFAGIEGFPASRRPRKPLGEVLLALREGRLRAGVGPLPGVLLRTSQPPPIPTGAQFLARSFTCAAGTRSYKLYVPASAPDAPRGLVVMLHGCKQDPDDFATGTNMNAVAEAHGLLVAYPCQPGSANASSCWNWFNPADQIRDAGEPSIIAGITRNIIAAFRLDRQQVFVAGLSAGGAMAAVMGETYPDLYSAVGIHSGLAYRSAVDVTSAFAAMRGDPVLPPVRARDRTGSLPRVRTIVFHGTADQTVDPSNAARIVEAASRSVVPGGARRVHAIGAAGRTSDRLVVTGPDGSPLVECWLIDGAGHAWAGGRSDGSFTDPRGPDASAEMMRFFLNSKVEHP